MTDTKKIKQTALTLLVAVGALLLWFLFSTTRIIWLTTQAENWSAIVIATLVVSTFFLLMFLVISSSLLLSIRKGETPFQEKNVKKLKAIALLLILFEPFHHVLERIGQFHIPIILEEGVLTYFPGEGYHYIGETTLQMNTSFGGFILATGLIIYCVALVFQYGISLQNQVDETL